MPLKQISTGSASLLSACFLAAGIAIGFLTANYLNRSGNSSAFESGGQPRPPQAPSAVANSQGGMMPDVAAVIEAARRSPDDFDAQMKAADLYLQIQRADKAREFLDAAAKIRNLDATQSILLGNAFFDIREFDLARPFYKMAVASKPDDANLRADLGVTYLEGKPPDLESAFREFEAALKIKPGHEPTLFNMGLAYLKKGDMGSASKTLDRLESSNPGNELAVRLKQSIDSLQSR